MPLTQTVELTKRAQTWLLTHQDESGGWAERPGGKVNVFNTAEVMLALFTSEMSGGDPAIRKSVNYLLTHGRDVPEEDRGAWGRDFGGENIEHVADLLRTSLAIRALIKAGKQDEAAVKDAVAWVVDIQSSHKEAAGWGYRRNAPAEIIPTGFALQALIQAHAAEMRKDLQKHIEKGLKYLVAQQNLANGSFGPSDTLVGVRTISAVLTLQAASKHKLSVYAKEETLAVQWVLANPYESRAVAEETATIDPERRPDGTGAGDYGVLYMPKLLTLQFEGLDRQAARELLMDFSEDFDDDSGGFYGRRIFSWSTALALRALCASHLESLPQPAPVYTGSKVGPAVLVFGVLVLVAVFVLALQNELTLLAGAIIVVMLLAILVAYGAIREKTFRELFVTVWKPFKGASKDKKEEDKE